MGYGNACGNDHKPFAIRHDRLWNIRRSTKNTCSIVVSIFVILLLQSCTICVNGAGIGCGNAGPVSPPAAAERQKAKDDELRRKLNRSFVRVLGQAAGAHTDESSPNVSVSIVSPEERTRVSSILEVLLKQLEEIAVSHNRDDTFRQYFQFPKRLPSIKIAVGDGKVPTAHCESNEISMPAAFISTLLQGGIVAAADGSISTPFIPTGAFYPGSVYRPFPKSEVEEFAEVIAVLNTAEYRTIAFVLAHESTHIWAGQCISDANPDVQRKREADADLFATIVASELYSGKCMTKPFVVSRETFAEMISEIPVSHDDLGETIADRMSEMELSRFLVAGAGDVQFLFATFADSLNPAEVAHPIPGLRILVDLRVRKLIVRQFYNDLDHKVKSSILMKVFVPKEDRDVLSEGVKIGVIGTQYQEYLSDDLLKCSQVTFR
jgi:hypothetical protein